MQLALPAGSMLLLVGSWRGMAQEAFGTQQLLAGSRGVLLPQAGRPCPVRQLHLESPPGFKVVIIQCPSPGPVCSGGLGVTSPASSVPYGGSNLCTPRRDAVFLQVCSRPRGRQSQRSPLGLSHQSNPHALGQGTLVRILPAAESVCSSRAFWNWGYDHKTVWGPTVRYVRLEINLH